MILRFTVSSQMKQQSNKRSIVRPFDPAHMLANQFQKYVLVHNEFVYEKKSCNINNRGGMCVVTLLQIIYDLSIYTVK